MGMSVNPWITIWTKPRETIRAILQYKVGYLFPLLSTIYGFALFLQASQNGSMGAKLPLWGIILGDLVAGFLVGLVVVNIGTALLYWTGRWIGGMGSYKEIRTALAWSYVPQLLNIAVWVLYMAVYGSNLFNADFMTQSFVGKDLAVIFIGSILQLAAVVWAVVILLTALSEVQKFSIWKAIVNVLLPTLIVIAALMVLTWLTMINVGTAGATQ